MRISIDIVNLYLAWEGTEHEKSPEYSFYLNLVENLFDILGCAVTTNFEFPSAVTELQTVLLEE